MDRIGSAGERPPRGALRLLVDPAFGTIFWGKLCAAAGVWIHGIVAVVLVYAGTGSALMVGLVSVVQFAPQLILSPISGGMADRGNAARQILLGRTMCFLGSASLTVWVAVYGAPIGMAESSVVLVFSFVVGLGFVVGGPAMQSIVPRLVRADELATAMALNTFPMTMARIVGPVLGALVASHWGPAPALALGTALHVPFIVLLILVRLPGAEARRAEVDYSVLGAVRHVWRDKPTLLMLLAVAGVGIGSEPSVTLAPVVAEALGGGVREVGLIGTSFGGGAGVTLLVLPVFTRRWRSEWLGPIGLWFMIAGLAIVAVGAAVAVTLAGFTIMGVGFAVAMTCLSTLLQQRTPPYLRGRVMSLWLVGFVGARPLAAVADGFLADTYSVGVAVIVTAGVLLAIALSTRPSVLSRSPPSTTDNPVTEAEQRTDIEGEDMVEIKPGARLRGVSSSTEVVVVKADDTAVNLSCSDEDMVALATPRETKAALSEDNSILVGKRYIEPDLGLEVLCTKSGPGPLRANGSVLVVKAAAALPASD